MSLVSVALLRSRGSHSSCTRGCLVPHQRKLGHGSEIWRKITWSQTECQGCPEIRGVPVATCRAGSLHISCPEQAEADSSSEWRVQASKHTPGHLPGKEMLLLYEMCFTSHLTTQFLLELWISFQTPFLREASQSSWPLPGVPFLWTSPHTHYRDNQELIAFFNRYCSHLVGMEGPWSSVSMFVYTAVARCMRQSRVALGIWRQSVQRKRHVPEALPDSEWNSLQLGIWVEGNF